MTRTRISTIADIETISLVLASSWKLAYRGIVHDDYLDALKDNHWIEFLTTGINNGSLFSMVIESNQKIIGAAIISQTKNEQEANLISFYLLPDKVGLGFGHIFYCAIESELRDRGFFKCVVDVLEHNKRAIRFYEAHGFDSTDEVINAVLGEQNYTCKVLKKTL